MLIEIAFFITKDYNWITCDKLLIFYVPKTSIDF